MNGKLNENEEWRKINIMSCLHPVEIKNPKYLEKQYHLKEYRTKYYKVPCGKCINCLSQKANEISTKFVYAYEHEFNYKGVFITLTYNDESIHYLTQDDEVDIGDEYLQEYELYNQAGQKLKLDLAGNPIETLCRKDFQLFIKRLRNELKPISEQMNWKPIKYLATSEYGTKGERPHYHAVILGIDGGKLTKELIKKCWSINYTEHKRTGCKIHPMGLIDVRTLTSGAGIGYVAKYTTKELEWQENDPREKPKVWHSAGMDNAIIRDYGIENLKQNNFQFKYGNRDFKVGYLGKYYIHKYGFKSHKDDSYAIEQMTERGIQKANGELYTREQIEQFKLEQSRIKAKERQKKLSQKGEPIQEEKGEKVYQAEIADTINQLNLLDN